MLGESKMRYPTSRLVPPLLCLMLLLILTTTAFGETWTDLTGNFSVEATFVKVEGRSVVLRKSDGNVINVPIDRLSDASRATAKRLYETQKNGFAGLQQGHPGGELGAGYPVGGTFKQAGDYLSQEARKGNFGIAYFLFPKNTRDFFDTEDAKKEFLIMVERYDVAGASIESTIDELVTLLTTKKKYILKSPLKSTMTPDGYQHFIRNYDDFVGVFKACHELFRDRRSIGKQKTSEFFQKHANQIGLHAKKFVFDLPASIPEFPLPDKGHLTQSGDTGQIVSGIPPATHQWRLVEGYWVPEIFALSAPETTGDQQLALEELRGYNAQPVDLALITKVGIIQGFASRAMQPMLAAKNQTEFDQAVLESLTVIKTLAAIASDVRAGNQN